MLGLSIPDLALRRAGTDPDALAIVARMSVAPEAARVRLIDAAVRGLKACGVWAKLDLLYLTAAHDAQAARLNWVAVSHALIPAGGPSFTADRGYAGNGSSSYLETGFSLSAAGHLSQNSASMGVWLNGGTDSGVNSAEAMGAVTAGVSGAVLCPRGAAGAIRGMLNQAGPGNAGGSVATRMGFSVLSRTAADQVAAYRNGVTAGSYAAASTVPSVQPLFLGGRNNGGVLAAASDNRIAAAFVGAGLSESEVAGLHAVLAAYLGAIGGI